MIPSDDKVHDLFKTVCGSWIPKDWIFELPKRGPYRIFFSFFNEYGVKTMFKPGDRIRVKGGRDYKGVQHPTENREVKEGDILTVVGTVYYDGQYYALYSILRQITNSLRLNRLTFYNVQGISYEACELFTAANDENTIEKVLMECTCKSLLFGHDNDCPLRR